jgi:TonB family protein
LAERREARVELQVMVLADGSVGGVLVIVSGGAEFDAAAVSAVRRWRFVPALRNGTPVASRITVPFRFSPPALKPVKAPQAAEPADNVPTEAGDATSSDVPAKPPPLPPAPVEITVEGSRELRTEDRSISHFRVSRDVLSAAPRQEGADVLRAAPGVYTGRGEGAAVAHNYMLRGFDAEHGQDIEFRVGGLPINLPSHLHGQGYADLGFVIAETVQELRVAEGVHDPRQGDFAVAGSIELALGVPESERGVRFASGYGSFDTYRELVLWAPRDLPDETFAAVELTETSGFGEHRAGRGASTILQHRFGSGPLSYRWIGILHAARANLAGVLRQDDIDAGRVCFYCVYPYPTAQAQNAASQRVLLGWFADYQGPEDNGQVGVWLGYDNFRLQENFTGFIQQSRTLERSLGRGDLIEQQNRTLSFGLTSRYRTGPFRPASWAHGTIEVGAEGRLDTIDQAQNLLDGVRNQTWDERVDAGVRGVDLGVWGDLDSKLGRFVGTRLGFRADALTYEIDDRLGNFAPRSRPQESFIMGFRRSASGIAFGPRASVEVEPLPWLSLLAAYGEGYRSPQARTLEDGESAPFSKVRSGDFGFRFDWGRPLELAVGGYYTHLSDDVTFDAEQGRLERVGATQRLGAVAHLQTRPLPWLVESLSFTFVNATLLEPPPASADQPDPPFTSGQRLPFVPPVVIRADLGARRALSDGPARSRLGARAGLGFSFISSRPLPHRTYSDPVALLDGSLGLSWGPLDLSLSLFNALDARYAAVEYNFVSDWDPNDGVRPRTPERHIAAGAPRSWMLSLGATL